MNELEKSLLLSESIKIAEDISPFWYTSGTLGPYFINTHFLLNNEKEANILLKFIDVKKEDHKNFFPELIDRLLKYYEINDIFKNSIDFIYTLLKKNKEFNESEYISGGERRDWFFSPIIAHLSNKKLLFIYKDLKVYDINSQITDIKNFKVCHICDLITQASSFKRAWIPAIKNINGKLVSVFSIVDRDEGGINFFKENNIKYLPFVIINKNFLNNLLKNKVINKNQLYLINNFKKNPTLFGKNYLLKNPDYLSTSIHDKKSHQKALRCINENPYNINFSEKPFNNIIKK